MKLILFTIIGVLAILGAFALLEWLTERATPADADVSRPRRSFLRLILALLGGVLIGSYAWHRDRQLRQELQPLFELELLLAQLDGLVNAALAQGDMTKLLPLIKELVSKIGEYGSKATRLLTALREQISPQDYYDLHTGAGKIAYALEQLENPTASDSKKDTSNNPLINMQEGIRLARAKTRELIDARISSF